MPIRSYSDDRIWAEAIIPNAGVNSNAISVPKDTKAMTVYLIAITGTSVNIQSLVPRRDIEGGAETWMDVWSFDPGDATLTQVGGVNFIGPNKAITVPMAGLGGGVIRLVSQAAEAAARTIVVAFQGFQG
jgi:hypothetical protein